MNHYDPRLIDAYPWLPAVVRYWAPLYGSDPSDLYSAALEGIAYGERTYDARRGMSRHGWLRKKAWKAIAVEVAKHGPWHTPLNRLPLRAKLATSHPFPDPWLLRLVSRLSAARQRRLFLWLQGHRWTAIARLEGKQPPTIHVSVHTSLAMLRRWVAAPRHRGGYPR